MGFAVFVIVVAAICTQLGFWQIHRLQHRLDTNQLIARHLAADPVELSTVVEPGRTVETSLEWTRVRATGRYDIEHEVTVTFSTRDGAPGVDVVTPLVMADGTAVLINRGWLSTKNTSARPENVPAPPAGQVSVTGWLRPDNGAGGAAVRPLDGKVRAISSVGMASFVPHRLVSGYLNLRTQQPAAVQPLALEPRPEGGQGPHFFYALQWWFFAGLAVVGWFWFAWAELKERRDGPRRSRPGRVQASETRSA